MYIVSVTPLTRTFPKEELSYYTKTDLPENTLVKVPLRKSLIYALVQKSTPVQNAKSLVKTSSFGMKKIDTVVRENFFTDGFLEAVKATASDHALGLGQVLECFTPKDLPDLARIFPKSPLSKTKTSKKKIPEALQAPFPVRLETYRSVVKETFQKQKSVFLVVPDQVTGETCSQYFEAQESYRENIFFFHSMLSQKKFEKETKRLMNNNAPALIISTPTYLSLPKQDIGAVILEDENKDRYRRQKRPFIDTRKFTEHFARHSNARFILGGSVLSTETFARLEKQQIKPENTYRKQIALPKNTGVEDMTKYRKDEKGFQLFSDKTLKTLRDSLEKKHRIFLFAVRGGVASITLCRDCGTIFYCPECSVPLSLENTPDLKEREFACRKCGFRKDARSPDKLFCSQCGGFQLEAFGLGVQKIREEVEKKFPNASVTQIDSANTKTHRSAEKEIKRFLDTTEAEPRILIGTEKALKYLNQAPDLSVVVSLDTLFAIPNFRINSKIFTLLAEIAENTRETLYIQTRNPDSSLLQTFVNGNIQNFHKHDLAERKRFDFPPFVKFIKITGTLKTAEERSQQEKIEYFFKHYEPLVYPGFVERVKNRYVINTLIRLKPDAPIPDDLKKRLCALPFDYEVRIDPESIL